jgi:hypothetical protein
MLRKECIKHFGAVPKARRFEALDRELQIGQPAPRGKIKNAQSSGDRKASRPCNRNGGPVIDK